MSNSNQELPFNDDEPNDTSDNAVLAASEIVKSFGPDGPSPDSPHEPDDLLTDTDIFIDTDANEPEKIAIISKCEAFNVEYQASIRKFIDYFQKYFKDELPLLVQNMNKC